MSDVLAFRDYLGPVREFYSYKGKTWDHCFVEESLGVDGVAGLGVLYEAHSVPSLEDQYFLNKSKHRKCLSYCLFRYLLF